MFDVESGASGNYCLSGSMKPRLGVDWCPHGDEALRLMVRFTHANPKLDEYLQRKMKETVPYDMSSNMLSMC